VTRDELEALVWRQSEALTCPVPKTRKLAMQVILTAADDYAVHSGGITAERRSALDVAVSAGLRTAHFQVPCRPAEHSGAESCGMARACMRSCRKTTGDVLVTPVAADVTCRRCRQSVPWLEARAAGRAS
jgi:hypothetical protein